MRLFLSRAAAALIIATSIQLCGIGIVSFAHGAVDWDRVLDRDNGHRVTFGAVLGGPEPFSRNADRAYAPASVTKMFTTAAALELLGADFRFATRLSWREVQPGNPEVIADLRMIGEGDPSWGMELLEEGGYQARLDRFVRILSDRGVREIRGPIRVVPVAESWGRLEFPPSWEPEDLNYCYGALVQAVNVQENCATYTVTSRTRGAWNEPGVPVVIKLQIASGTRTSLQAEAVNDAQAGKFGFLIKGTWARSSGPVAIRLPVLNSMAWAQNLFIGALKKKGIRLDARAEPVIAGESRTVALYSPVLVQIVSAVNKPSNNMAAEALARTLGHRLEPTIPSLLDAGIAAMKRYLLTIDARNDQRGRFAGAMTLWDGSGLSRENRVTARAVQLFLEDQLRQPHFPVFWDSLSIAGVDGTLESRMRGTAAEGVLRGKTGTLRGYYQLAGYVPWGASFIPFVVLSEADSAYRSAARAAQDRVGAALSSFSVNKIY